MTVRTEPTMPGPSPFHGLSAFPITPADQGGRVDRETLGNLIERLCEADVDSIGLLGSTGTYAYLTWEERRRAVETAVECVRGRVWSSGAVHYGPTRRKPSPGTPRPRGRMRT